MNTKIRFPTLLVSAIALVFILACLSLPWPPDAPAPHTPTPTSVSPTPRPKSTPQTSQSLQLENNLPQTPLSPRPSGELPDNHIGVHFEHYERYSDTEHVYSNGFKWIRIQSLTEFWGDGNNLKTFSLDSIPPYVDDVISGYTDNGVNIVLDLLLGAGIPPIGTTFQSEEEINRYLDYVRFVVSHFRDRIHYYQIWNEPGDVAVNDYANLVRQVVPVIREVDPGAKIIIPGMYGRWEDGYPGYGIYQRFSLDIDYLNELLLSGVAPMVDGISWHPFYGNMPSDPYYQDYPQMLQGIKELAASQGFTGEYFADEILWNTVDEKNWDGGPPVSRLIAAKYYTRTITMHRGVAVNVTINTFFQEPFLAPIHNLCDILAGAEPTDVTLSLQTIEHANVRYYAFALPNGDRLVALWTNDEAVEDDPGVSATLTIPGSSAQRVIGVDVLNGFKQELITETENGDLVIRNLLVKDYPIILRFVGPHFAEPRFAEPRFVEPTESPVEPVTIKLKRAGDERIPAGTPIQLTIGWVTDTEEQVGDFLAAINVTGTLDGQPLPDLNDYWGEIEPYEGVAGGQGHYISQWLYPLGVLSPGTHTVEIRGTLNRPVTDGYDSNKDGQLDEYSGEIWRFSLRMEVN